MPGIISATTFRPRKGKATELLALLENLQQQIRAEPGNVDYSLNQALSTDAVLVIQVFESEDAFTDHGARMAAIDAPARLAALTTNPLTRPELFQALPERVCCRSL